MEWWLFLILIVGIFLVLLAVGLPVFLAFTIVDVVGIYFFWGGGKGLEQLIHSIFSSISTFVLLPVPMFVLMGELLFHSGAFVNALDTLDKWMGRIPGRLCMLSVGGATLFSTLSGSSMGTCAMLGSMLLPEMEKRGYHRTIAIGSCMSGALAMIIPPSALAVILGSLMEISIGKLLISGIVPGLLMAVMYIGYIAVRCALQPSLAPDYVPERVPWSDRIRAFSKYVLPFGVIIFVVTGLIFAGMATPTESAAMGVLATAAVVAAYRKLSWSVLRKSVNSTLRITVMMFMILTGSTAFSQILAYTGASRGLVELVVSFPLPQIMIVAVMQALMISAGHIHGVGFHYDDHLSDLCAHREDSGFRPRLVWPPDSYQHGNWDENTSFWAGSFRHERRGSKRVHHGGHLQSCDSLRYDRYGCHVNYHGFPLDCHGATKLHEALRGSLAL